MVPTKTAKACKAMKAYGISEETVKVVLKDLLPGRNWTLIESENYRVLLDAIYDSQESKIKEVKGQEFMLRDESEGEEVEECEQPLKRSRLNSSSDDDSSPYVSSRSAIVEQAEESQVFASEGKSMPSERGKVTTELGRRYNEKACAFELPCDELPLAIIHPGSIPIMCSVTKDFDWQWIAPSNMEFLLARSFDIKDVAYAHPNLMGTDGSIDGNSSDAKENYSESPYIISTDEDDMYHPSKKESPSTAITNGLDLPDIIDLDADEQSAPSEQLCVDGSSNRNSSALEGKIYCSDSNLMVTENNDNGTMVSSKMDISSSSKGEVKLSFLYNSLQPSKFQVPSLDAVLTHMEAKCRKSFGILDPEFSLSTFLRDMCESFLEHVDTEQGPAVQEPSSSCSLVVVQKFDPIDSNTLYFIDDITRGNEAHKISLINEFNDEKQPTFTYIPKNLTFDDAYVKFVLARISDDSCCSNCFGNCMSQEIPCACAGETGGEFAYTSEGLVKEKFLESFVSINYNPQEENYFYCDACPLERTKRNGKSGKCKGHLVRKFIKECWYKCGCDQNCGNRVVQRGITAHLQVFMTPGEKGWGVRTLTDLPKGAFVCEYVGEIVTNIELYDRNTSNSNERHTYPVLLDADWSSEGVLRDEDALCLDATSLGNVARFVNHRCNDANMVEIPVEVESPDHHYYHLAFFTTREVKAFEELTWDYGIDFFDRSHPVKAFKCHCGSEYCRDMKPRKRTRT